jgi:hypothetical protein
VPVVEVPVVLDLMQVVELEVLVDLDFQILLLMDPQIQ